MINRFKLVQINSEYCDYLRLYESRVPYNFANKNTRPFVGILFKIGELEYFAPLSSPKEKHKRMKNTIDFVRINNGIYGAVNFNNMIPVKKNNYIEINLNKYDESTAYNKKYTELLKNQINWLNKNYEKICNKSYKLYTLYINNRLDEKIKIRCCNFKLLEEKCSIYAKEKIAL